MHTDSWYMNSSNYLTGYDFNISYIMMYVNTLVCEVDVVSYHIETENMCMA